MAQNINQNVNNPQPQNSSQEAFPATKNTPNFPPSRVLETSQRQPYPSQSTQRIPRNTEDRKMVQNQQPQYQPPVRTQPTGYGHQVRPVQSEPNRVSQGAPKPYIPPTPVQPQAFSHEVHSSAPNLTQNMPNSAAQSQAESTAHKAPDFTAEKDKVMSTIRRLNSNREAIPAELIRKVYNNFAFTDQDIKEVLQTKDGKKNVRSLIKNIGQRNVKGVLKIINNFSTRGDSGEVNIDFARMPLDILVQVVNY